MFSFERTILTDVLEESSLDWKIGQQIRNSKPHQMYLPDCLIEDTS